MDKDKIEQAVTALGIRCLEGIGKVLFLLVYTLTVGVGTVLFVYSLIQVGALISNEKAFEALTVMTSLVGIGFFWIVSGMLFYKLFKDAYSLPDL